MTEQEQTQDTPQPVTNCVTERRIGRFSVSRELLDLVPSDRLAFFFKHFVIVRAEFMFHANVIEYVAYSDLFRSEHPAYEPPVYDIQIAKNDGIVSISATPRQYIWADYQAANRQAIDDIAAFVGGTR